MRKTAKAMRKTVKAIENTENKNALRSAGSIDVKPGGERKDKIDRIFHIAGYKTS